MSFGLVLLLSVTPPSGDVLAPAPEPAAPPASELESPTVAPPPSAAPEPQEIAASEAIPEETGSQIYVDYTDAWHEDPPSSLYLTEVVFHPEPLPYEPPAPPPPPEPTYSAHANEDQPRVHGFLGLSLRGTTTNHNPSALAGGRVGFVFDDRFAIGGAFYSLTARYAGPIVDPRGNELGMRMAYGGVLLAWTLYKGRVLDVGIESLAAAGAACISTHERYVGRWSCIEKVGLVSIEPGLTLGMTVSDWLRVGMTAGYRFVTREAWRPPNDFTLSGPYVGLDFDFGAFRGPR